ncbi:MAG: response regulator [Rhodospirillales bacterium]|nr:response regulator [Rhodospirillales bacterium]
MAEPAARQDRAMRDWPRLQPPTRVMVVDDNYGVRESTCDLLRDEGHFVVAAASALEALRELARLPDPVTLLIDVNLGAGVNGLTLAGRIRHARPRCPILFMSGASPPPGFRFDGFIEKPFPAERLLAELRIVEARAMERGQSPFDQADLTDGRSEYRD